MATTIGFLLAGILGVAASFLFVTLGKVAQENQQLRMKLLDYQGKEISFRINSMLLNSKAEAKPKLQKTTEQLLVLAVKNTNENEARAAAVQACKRIHKELGLK